MRISRQRVNLLQLKATRSRGETYRNRQCQYSRRSFWQADARAFARIGKTFARGVVAYPHAVLSAHADTQVRISPVRRGLNLRGSIFRARFRA